MARSIAELPAAFQCVFEGRFRYFNALQSDLFALAFHTATSLVVSAPTGSGKTGVMELGILNFFADDLDPATGEFCHVPGRKKVCFVAPMKALVAEKAAEWARVFGPLGLAFHQLTADSEALSAAELDRVDVLLTTPEKLESITRRSRDTGFMGIFGSVGLVLVDEVHILHDERGRSLEALICRLKLLSNFPEMAGSPIAALRFIAASATIPNAHDIAAWLGVPREGLRCYGEEMRPVPLRTEVLGFNAPRNPYFFNARLNEALPGVLRQHGRGRPALVFCNTRKEVVDGAQRVADQSGGSANFVSSEQQREALHAAAGQLNDKRLKGTVVRGVAFHNAAMDQSDRLLVEALFRERKIVVLFCTSTLAYGVNLPAYLVVIKGTQHWSSESTSWEEYTNATCLQMAGRAGRSRFDSEGVCVIMTEKGNARRYEDLVAGVEEVESNLIEYLPECLNSEIQLLTVNSLDTAMQWLESTYFVQRVRQNSRYYAARYRKTFGGLRQRLDTPQGLKGALRQLANDALAQLAELGLIAFDLQQTGEAIKPMEPGRIMCRFYLRFETMKLICEAPANLSMYNLLVTLSQAKEFDFRIRKGEKKLLNGLNHAGRIKHLLLKPGSQKMAKLPAIKEKWHKVFLLANAALSPGRIELDASLRGELSVILHVGPRIAQAAARYFRHTGAFAATAQAQQLATCLRQHMWHDSVRQVEQLRNVGRVIGERLRGAGYHTVADVAAADPNALEACTKQRFPFGRNLRLEAMLFPPAVGLAIEVLETHPASVRCAITLRRTEPGAGGDAHRQGGGNGDDFLDRGLLVVGNRGEDRLLHSEAVDLRSFPSPYVRHFDVRISGGTQFPIRVVGAVLSEAVCGRDATIVHEIPRSAVPRNLKRARTLGECDDHNGRTDPPPERAAGGQSGMPGRWEVPRDLPGRAVPKLLGPSATAGAAPAHRIGGNAFEQFRPRGTRVDSEEGAAPAGGRGPPGPRSGPPQPHVPPGAPPRQLAAPQPADPGQVRAVPDPGSGGAPDWVMVRFHAPPPAPAGPPPAAAARAALPEGYRPERSIFSFL